MTLFGLCFGEGAARPRGSSREEPSEPSAAVPQCHHISTSTTNAEACNDDVGSGLQATQGSSKADVTSKWGQPDSKQTVDSANTMDHQPTGISLSTSRSGERLSTPHGFASLDQPSLSLDNPGGARINPSTAILGLSSITLRDSAIRQPGTSATPFSNADPPQPPQSGNLSNAGGSLEGRGSVTSQSATLHTLMLQQASSNRSSFAIDSVPAGPGGEGGAPAVPRSPVDGSYRASMDAMLLDSANLVQLQQASIRPSSFEEQRDISGLFASVGGSSSAGGGGAMPSGASNVLRRSPSTLPTVLETGIHGHLKERYMRLLVLPPQAPAPTCMLRKLWKLDSQLEVLDIVDELEEISLVCSAQLPDGTTWVKMPSEALNIEVDLVHHAAVHAELIESYLAEVPEPAGPERLFQRQLSTGPEGLTQLQLSAIKDDGYILLNIGHHLLLSGQTSQLKELLTDPYWIESKLHAYGVSAIVQDYRRYLSVRPEDADVKLLLQAFMLSLGSCMEHPTVSMLRQQMLARLIAYSEGSDSSAWLKRWYKTQAAQLKQDLQQRNWKGTSVHLMPRSATLEQAGGVHRMTLRGQAGSVLKVAICPDGRNVITVSSDGVAQLWDMNVGDCVMQLTRKSAMTDVAVAPDGEVAIVGTQDGTCCLWDLKDGRVRHVLKGHSSQVNAVDIDSKGYHCVTASNDGTVRVWHTGSGECIDTVSGKDHGNSEVFDVALSSDGTLAAYVSNDFLGCVWNLDGQHPGSRILSGHTGWVVSVEFIAQSHLLVTASHDATARVWDGDTGKCLHVLEGHQGRLNKVVVDASGESAVTCSDDQTARVWNLHTGECTRVLEGHGAWISGAAITRGGARIVTISGDSTGTLWDAASGKAITQLEGHSEGIRHVTLTYLGRFAVTASDDCTARVWDIQATPLPKVVMHAGRVKQLRALPDGVGVISVGDDGVAFVWDSRTGASAVSVSCHSAGISYARASDDGVLAVTGSSNRNICVWEVATGNPIVTIPAQPGSRVKDMVFDAACTFAVVLLFDSTVSVLELATGQVVSQLIKRGDRAVHSSGVNALLLAARGDKLVTMSKDGTAGVWDIRSASLLCILKGHTDGIVCAAFNPMQTVLVTASIDKTIRAFNAADGRLVLWLEVPGVPTGLVVSPSGDLVALSLMDGQVALWDMMRKPVVWAAQKTEINGLAFSPDGRLLATWGQDCTVRLWDCTAQGRLLIEGLPPGQPAPTVALYMADSGVTCCCFVVGAGGGSGVGGGGGSVGEDEGSSGSREGRRASGGKGGAGIILAVGDARGHVHFLDCPATLTP